MKFLGYRRPDGKVGIRNKIFILPASVCASDTTRIIASQIEGAVTFNNQNGCSQVAGDQQLTMDVMAGMAANPNVYGINCILSWYFSNGIESYWKYSVENGGICIIEFVDRFPILKGLNIG